MKPELKCHCPVRYSHAVSATRLYCKFLFKSPALLACPIVHLSGTKDADYRFDFLSLELRPRCKRGFPDGLAAF